MNRMSDILGVAIALVAVDQDGKRIAVDDVVHRPALLAEMLKVDPATLSAQKPAPGIPAQTNGSRLISFWDTEPISQIEPRFAESDLELTTS